MSNDYVSDIILKLPQKYRVYPVLFGAILIHLTIGTYHTFGNMLPYLASYMKRQNPNISIDDLMWIPTLQGCFPFAMVIGGYLSSKLGPRTTTLIGCFIMNSGVFLSSYTVNYSLFYFTMTYGIMFGFGQGIAYVVAVSTVINWAPESVGLFSGIVAGSFGISAAIFTPIQTAMINPENFITNKDGYFVENQLLDRIPNIFFILSVIYGIMQIVGSIFICDPLYENHFENNLKRYLADNQDIHDDKNLTISTISSDKGSNIKSKIYGVNDGKNNEYFEISLSPSLAIPLNVSTTYDSHSDAMTEVDVSLMNYLDDKHMTIDTVIKSSTFYALFFTLFCCSFYGNLFYNLYKTFANTFIDDDMFIAIAFSSGTIANALARICWGIMADKLSFQCTLTIATSTSAILLLTLPFTKYGGKMMYFTWLIFMFICIAANQTLFITAAVKCFGSKYKSINYGLLILSTTISGILLSAICQTLLSKIGYNWMFITASIFAFFALIMATLTRYTPHGRCISIKKKEVKENFQSFYNYVSRKQRISDCSE